MKKRYTIVVHGGAGDELEPKTPEEQRPFLDGLRAALDAGKAVLEAGGKAEDAVVAAVQSMEDSPLFNAGKGAAFVADGSHRLDASLMKGNLECGVVAGVQRVKNPILAARRLLEKNEIIFVAGDDVDAFAREEGLELVENNYFSTQVRYDLWRQAIEEQGSKGGHDTIGAVALDAGGALAAATSTGGLKNARVGRVGDSAVIGAGTYANDETVAVSCTGTGEQFIRYTVAHEVHALMKYAGCSVHDAAEKMIREVLQKGDGGLIAVDRNGNVAMPFNTPQMWRGVADSDGRYEVMLD